MKKRIIAAILAAAMTLSLAACGGQAGETEQKTIAPLTQADLSFIFVETGNTAIAIGMTAEQIEKNFGVTLEGLRNWTGDAVSVIFGNSTNYPFADSPQAVFTNASLTGASDKLTTPRGIKVGDTWEDVIAAYGEPTVIHHPYLIYAREGLSGGLLFDMSGQKLVNEILINNAEFMESYLEHIEETTKKGDR